MKLKIMPLLAFTDLQWFAHSMLKVMVRVSERLTVEALLQEHMAFLVQSWSVRIDCIQLLWLIVRPFLVGYLTPSYEAAMEIRTNILRINNPFVFMHTQSFWS